MAVLFLPTKRKVCASAVARGGKGVVLRVILHLRDWCFAVGIKEWDVGLALGVEVDGRHLVEHPHRVFDGGRENLPDGLLVLKLDLGLGGMDVDVYVLGVDIKINKIGHLFALGQQAVEGLHDSLAEIRVAHVAPIDEEELMCAFLLARLGLAHEAADAAHRGLDMYGQQVLVDALAKHLDDALAQLAGPEVEHLRPVAVEGEGDVGVDEHDALEGRDDIVEFGGVRLQELPACGHVIKQILDEEVGTLGTRAGLLSHKPRPGDGEVCAQVGTAQTRLEFHLCHCRDGSQGLAPEAHGMEVEEVVGHPDLRRGVPLERQACVGLRHALAVVDDLDGGAAGIDHRDVYVAGSGIHGVLDEFLDD